MILEFIFENLCVLLNYLMSFNNLFPYRGNDIWWKVQALSYYCEMAVLTWGCCVLSFVFFFFLHLGDYLKTLFR